MSDNSKIDLIFADGSYTFALPIARISELERKCGLPGPPIGIGKIFSRVLAGHAENEKGEIFLVAEAAQFHAVDLVETVRQGLIGGGRGIVNEEEIIVTPALADRLIATYLLGRPLKEAWELSVAILAACIVGYDPPKKD